VCGCVGLGRTARGGGVRDGRGVGGNGVLY